MQTRPESHPPRIALSLPICPCIRLTTSAKPPPIGGSGSPPRISARGLLLDPKRDRQGSCAAPGGLWRSGEGGVR